MFTSQQLVAYVLAVYDAKWVYWYGTCGYKCSDSLYASKARQYPGHYTSGRKAGYMRDIANGKWCADCVGMIKSFFWSGNTLHGKSKYASNNCPDVSANGMIDLCRVKGDISTMPDIPGLVVWKSGHIGVYIGGGYTIEMRGFDYDCVRRKVSAGPWTKWGKLPMLSYDADIIQPAAPDLGDRDLSNGCSGEDVRQLQQALIELGYDCGKWGADGDFGDATEMAVKRFQKATGLTADGIAGPLTLGMINDLLDAAKPNEGDARAQVTIVGGSCYIRSEPSTSGVILGVATEGTTLHYAGETAENGWLKVDITKDGVQVKAWVSGKYGRLV